MKRQARDMGVRVLSDEEVGAHPLIPGEDIKVDDSNASVVLVFPKIISPAKAGCCGGEPESTIVEDPVAQASKIFVRKKNRAEDSLDTTTSGFHDFATGEITITDYQNQVRDKVMHVLEISGMQAECFSSIDHDEVFVKVSLKEEGDAIRSLAERYDYQMRLTDEAYEKAEPQGDYEGHAPMTNALGRSIAGFKAYEKGLDKVLVPFDNIDEIRLIMLRLGEWVNLNECVNQKVLSRYFPATKYDQLHDLHDNWSNLRHMLRLPTHDHEPQIRAYFGEEIAMFFRWFSFYVRMLLPLGVFAGICALRRVDAIGLNFDQQRWIQIGFAVILVFWSSIFNKLFKSRSSRAAQEWGTLNDENRGAHALELASYDPDLDGTAMQRIRRLFTRAFTVGFILVFVGCIAALETVKADKRAHGDKTFNKTYAPLLTAVLISGGGWIWGKIAPVLTNIQNHRTAARYQKDLTFTLSVVKIFVALWPFLVPAFILKYEGLTCGTSVIDAAAKVYEKSGWPGGIEMACGTPTECAKSAVPPSDAAMSWLTPQYTTTREDMKCVFGCYPADCFEVNGARRCVTNCIEDLEASLLTVFLINLVVTFVFLIVPMFLVHFEIKKEIAKVNGPGSDDSASEEEREMYTLLQLQAKCDEVAPYEYYSWGYSRVEDFLELAIDFALLTSFGIVLPVMALVAFFSTMIKYRLVAYRMTNVTARPLPLLAGGIGEWETVFNALSIIAIVVNAALAVFVMQPMRSWTTEHEFLAFIAIEHALLAVRYVVYLFVPDHPEDVRRIDDFNGMFVNSGITQRPKLKIPASETYDHTKIDVTVTEDENGL